MGTLDSCFQQLSNVTNRFLFFFFKKSYDGNGGGAQGVPRRASNDINDNDDKHEAGAGFSTPEGGGDA